METNENGETVVKVLPFFYKPSSAAILCHVQVCRQDGKAVSTQTDQLLGSTGKRILRERGRSAVPKFLAESVADGSD